MIFPEYPCIFLHSVKTAGTSVERWLLGPDAPFPPTEGRERMFGWDDEFGVFRQHATPEIIQAIVGQAMFARSYRFTVVRNPFARVVSMYFYQRQGFQQRFNSFEGFVRALAPTIPSGPGIVRNYCLPQVRYAYPSDAPGCDALVHFEALPTSLQPVAEHLGIVRPLPFLNARRYPERGSRPASSFYTAETAGLVAEAYAEDFSRLGYSTDPTHADAAAPPPGTVPVPRRSHDMTPGQSRTASQERA